MRSGASIDFNLCLHRGHALVCYLCEVRGQLLVIISQVEGAHNGLITCVRCRGQHWFTYLCGVQWAALVYYLCEVQMASTALDYLCEVDRGQHWFITCVRWRG